MKTLLLVRPDGTDPDYIGASLVPAPISAVKRLADADMFIIERGPDADVFDVITLPPVHNGRSLGYDPPRSTLRRMGTLHEFED